MPGTQPLRRIVGYKRMGYGFGFPKFFLLECGHTVRILRADYSRKPKTKRCPDCEKGSM